MLPFHSLTSYSIFRSVRSRRERKRFLLVILILVRVCVFFLSPTFDHFLWAHSRSRICSLQRCLSPRNDGVSSIMRPDTQPSPRTAARLPCTVTRRGRLGRFSFPLPIYFIANEPWKRTRPRYITYWMSFFLPLPRFPDSSFFDIHPSCSCLLPSASAVSDWARLVAVDTLCDTLCEQLQDRKTSRWALLLRTRAHVLRATSFLLTGGAYCTHTQSQKGGNSVHRSVCRCFLSVCKLAYTETDVRTPEEIHWTLGPAHLSTALFNKASPPGTDNAKHSPPSRSFRPMLAC